jgi:hypothetical protein
MHKLKNENAAIFLVVSELSLLLTSKMKETVTNKKKSTI